MLFFDTLKVAYIAATDSTLGQCFFYQPPKMHNLYAAVRCATAEPTSSVFGFKAHAHTLLQNEPHPQLP